MLIHGAERLYLQDFAVTRGLDLACHKMNSAGDSGILMLAI